MAERASRGAGGGGAVSGVERPGGGGAVSGGGGVERPGGGGAVSGGGVERPGGEGAVSRGGVERPGVKVRDRLVLALDVDDLEQARRLALELFPWFGVVKVGLELFSAAGPQAVADLVDLGFEVFLDLKFADIPTTVRRATRVVGSLGPAYLTAHASGGVEMLRAGVEGLEEGAEAAGLAPPALLAVTVLTSEARDPGPVLVGRVERAVSAGCGGVVCAAEDLPEVHRVGPGLVTAVPGIRPRGVAVHDQRRSATPAQAWAAGADLLVVGRPVTAAPDRKAAAAAITADLQETES